MGGEEQQAFFGRTGLFIFSEVQNQTSVFCERFSPHPQPLSPEIRSEFN